MDFLKDLQWFEALLKSPICFFADDSLLFCKADASSCHALKDILTRYEQASGQKINFRKSALSFSPSTPHDVRGLFQFCLGMNVCECHEQYLGLPTISGRNKTVLFKSILDRIWGGDYHLGRRSSFQQEVKRFY